MKLKPYNLFKRQSTQQVIKAMTGVDPNGTFYNGNDIFRDLKLFRVNKAQD